MNIKKYIPNSLKQPIKDLIVQAVKSAPVRGYYSQKCRSIAAARSSVKLHFGCGPRHLDGWINVDLFPNTPQPDVLLDVEKPLPLKSGTVDYIFSEDLLEHLSYGGAKNFLSECARVLKPGGKLRLGTPDLVSFMKAYLDRSQGDLDWYAEHCGVNTFAEMFNYGTRAWGHTFIYDEETLTLLLEQRGFEVERKDFNQTETAAFAGLDLRNPEEGAHSLFVECTKTTAPVKKSKALAVAAK